MHVSLHPSLYFQTYIDLFSKITTINWATVIVSLCCIVVLVIGKVNVAFISYFLKERNVGFR